MQLTDRFWKIYDSLNKTEIVEGEGVVGQSPILKPNDHYSYSSGCFLESNIGAMNGYYKMINTATLEEFKVISKCSNKTLPIPLLMLQRIVGELVLSTVDK